MALEIDDLIKSIYLQDNVFKCSTESWKFWSMKQFGNLPLSKWLKGLHWQSSDPLCSSEWFNAHTFLKLTEIIVKVIVLCSIEVLPIAQPWRTLWWAKAPLCVTLTLVECCVKTTTIHLSFGLMKPLNAISWPWLGRSLFIRLMLFA